MIDCEEVEVIGDIGVRLWSKGEVHYHTQTYMSKRVNISDEGIWSSKEKTVAKNYSSNALYSYLYLWQVEPCLSGLCLSIV